MPAVPRLRGPDVQQAAIVAEWIPSSPCDAGVANMRQPSREIRCPRARRAGHGCTPPSHRPRVGRAAARGLEVKVPPSPSAIIAEWIPPSQPSSWTCRRPSARGLEDPARRSIHRRPRARGPHSTDCCHSAGPKTAVPAPAGDRATAIIGFPSSPRPRAGRRLAPMGSGPTTPSSPRPSAAPIPRHWGSTARNRRPPRAPCAGRATSGDHRGVDSVVPAPVGRPCDAGVANMRQPSRRSAVPAPVGWRTRPDAGSGDHCHCRRPRACGPDEWKPSAAA